MQLLIDASSKIIVFILSSEEPKIALVSGHNWKRASLLLSIYIIFIIIILSLSKIQFKCVQQKHKVNYSTNQVPEQTNIIWIFFFLHPRTVCTMHTMDS